MLISHYIKKISLTGINGAKIKSSALIALIKTEKPRFFASVFVVLVFVYLSFSALLELARRWSHEPEYGHGWLVPCIVAYLCAQYRERLHRQPPSAVAVVLMALASLMTLVGMVSGLFLLIQLALVVVLMALVALWWGIAGLRMLLWPLGFLIFCIPLPYVIEVAFTAQLQLLSSRIAVDVIRMMGIVVYLSGNVIDLGVVKLQVVEACSGLRYLYPLMSLGYLAAYCYQGPLWIRGVIFVATIPITVALNSLRIAVMAWLVEHFGLAVAEGFFHDFEGWLIFALCMVLLALLLWSLNAIFTRQSIWQWLDITPSESAAYAAPPVGRTRLWGALSGVWLLSALTLIAGYSVAHRQLVIPPAANMSSFPLMWGSWQGVHRPLTAGVAESLGVDDYLLIDFSTAQVSAPVNFYVAYYANQRAGQSPHSPKVCIPGGGWQIEAITRIAVKEQKVNRVVISRQGVKQLVYYGFVERGEWAADEYWRKWLLLKDFLVYGRSDGALIRLTTPLHAQERIEDADARLADLLVHLRVGITAYLPAPPQ